jgi:hypothetical protein
LEELSVLHYALFTSYREFSDEKFPFGYFSQKISLFSDFFNHRVYYQQVTEDRTMLRISIWLGSLLTLLALLLSACGVQNSLPLATGKATLLFFYTEN